MSIFDIFKQNQVLYIEFGIIYVILNCLMMFLPLSGFTYVISSVILFWLFIGLLILVMNQNIKKELDFEDLFQDKKVPAKLQLLLTSIAIIALTIIEVTIFNNYYANSWLINFIQMILTILQSLILSLITLKLNHLIFTSPVFVVLSTFVTCITLFFGGIFFVPFIFIKFFKRKVL